MRAILSGQAKVPPASAGGEIGVNNAALLAAFLKAEGIEPPSPANQLREQLFLAVSELKPQKNIFLISY